MPVSGAAYGTQLYGAGYYGPQTPPGLQWKLQVDWDNDNVFEADEGPRMIAPGPVIDRGRPRMFDEGGITPESVGTLSLTLDNRDDRFTPWYASGPLYGNLKPNRRALLQVIDGSTTYYVFHGYIKSIDPIDFVNYQARMVVEDGWRKLKTANADTVLLQTNLTTDVAIGVVLDASSWPTALGRTLDVGSDRLPWFWGNGKADRNIQALADSEFGRFVISPQDGARFYSRSTLVTQAPTLTLSADLILKDKIVLGSVLDNIRNAITVKAHPVVQQAVAELWRLQDPAYISAGQTIALKPQYQFQGRPVAAVALPPSVSIATAALNSAYTVGGQIDLANGGGGQVWLFSDSDVLKISDATKTTYVEVRRVSLLTSTQTYQTRTLFGTVSGVYATGVGTTVTSIDVAVNSQADGLGIDITGRIGFPVAILYSQTAALSVLLSAPGASGYILVLRLRGSALYQPDTTPATFNDAAGQADYGPLSLTLDLPWQQDILKAQDFAGYLSSFLASQSVSPRVTIENRPSVQFAYDLVNRVTLDLPTIGLTSDFRIGRIQHSWKNGLAQAPLTEWTLEPIPTTSYFLLDVSLLDGADLTGVPGVLAY